MTHREECWSFASTETKLKHKYKKETNKQTDTCTAVFTELPQQQFPKAEAVPIKILPSKAPHNVSISICNCYKKVDTG